MIDAFDGPFPDPYGCGAVIFLGTDCAETTPAGGARAPESATGAADDAGSDGDDSAEEGFNAGDDLAPPLAAARPLPLLGLASPLGPASAPPVGSATD